jgi:hypothetical protein
MGSGSFDQFAEAAKEKRTPFVVLQRITEKLMPG